MDRQNLLEVKRQLDEVGPGFCLAKWTQVTVHLGIGQTHSCHHPPTHKIPLEEIKIDVSALHNTKLKKDRRGEMLSGIRPKECSYCWAVEDLKNSDNFSDRVLKSAEEWSWPHLNEVLDVADVGNIRPKYLEVSFSNVCNFKCSYCSPAISSKWMEEIERHGHYNTHLSYNNLDTLANQGKIPIRASEHNPYVEAFWQWLPTIWKSLHTFRITGGEPLLDKNLFKVLDYIIENPNPNLELSINTNMCVPDELYSNFLKKIKTISENKFVKSIHLFTSCEAYGVSAEYIRYGLDYTTWYRNCERYIKEIPESIICVMATYNNLSVPTFKIFLEDVLKLIKKTFFKTIETKSNSEFRIDIPHLTYPGHQSITILTEEYKKYFEEQLQFMRLNSTENKEHGAGFSEEEIHKMQRVKDTFEQSLKKDATSHTEILRKDFAIFVDEHDKRRKTNFLETFPELTNFYNHCKSLSI
jgi:organic radical activating enzyme